MNSSRLNAQQFLASRPAVAPKAGGLDRRGSFPFRDPIKVLICGQDVFHQPFDDGHAQNFPMSKPPINVILAQNLAHFMSEKKLTQMALSVKTGVAQSSISNYLSPGKRAVSKSGKAPSAKLSEVELIADALGVEAWELLRFISPSERDFYLHVEQAYRSLLIDAAKAPAKVIKQTN